MSVDPLGQGFAFPLRTTPAGGVALSGQERKIEEAIRTVVGTQRGERLMRPDFGSNLKSLVFAPNSKATANLARHYVVESLRAWEPRIEVEEVAVENDPGNGRLLIDVRYRIRSTFERRNLVFPFYLQPRSGPRGGDDRGEG